VTTRLATFGNDAPPARRQGAYLKGIRPCGAIGKLKLNPESYSRLFVCGLVAEGIKIRSSHRESVIEGASKAIPAEPKGIKEVGFAGTIRADQNTEVTEFNVANRDAPEVFDTYAPQKA
jgi:hypothetical protein